MSRLMRWVVPDHIFPTDFDRLLIAVDVAVKRLSVVLDGVFRKALVSDSWETFRDATTVEERDVYVAFMKAARELARK